MGIKFVRFYLMFCCLIVLGCLQSNNKDGTDTSKDRTGTWSNFISLLEENDMKKVKNICTKNAYSKLSNFLDIEDDFSSLYLYLKDVERKIKISENEILIMVDNDMDGAGFLFVKNKENDKFLLNDIYFGK